MTKDQLQAYVQIVKAFADTIRELGEVPAGHVYAHAMGRMSLDTFNGIVGTLVRSGLVAKRGDLLCWVGVPCETHTVDCRIGGAE